MAHFLAAALAVLLLGAVVEAVVQFSNAGPPPDVVGAYTSKDSIGVNAADGSFTYQYADSASDSGGGVYLSYECVGDGSGWNAVYNGYTYGSDGNFTVTTNCEKGSVANGLYTSTFAETEACPLISTAAAQTDYYTQVPGSALGALLNAPFCTASQKGVLDHPIVPSVAPAAGS